MPRIRSVSPDICVSTTMAAIPAHLERTFVRLWTHCDDQGRCLDNPKLIKAAIYPLHDDVTAADVDDQLRDLAAAGLLIRYTAAGKRCIEVRSWDEYQHPKNPAKPKLPPPETRDHTEHSPITTPALPPNGVRHAPLELEVGVGGEKEGEGESEGEGPPPPSSADAAEATPPSTQRQPRHRLPNPWPLTDDLRAQALEANPGCDPAHEHAQFVDHHRARPNVRIADWPAEWRKWCRNAHTKPSDASGPRPQPAPFAADLAPVNFDAALANLRAIPRPAPRSRSTDR